MGFRSSDNNFEITVSGVTGIKFKSTGINLTPQASTPLNLTNGDIWVTSAGLGVQTSQGTLSFTGGQAPSIDARNTVISGSADADGLPTYLTSSSLTVTLNTTTGVYVTFANGYDSNGAINYIEVLSSNKVLNVPANSTSYLYLERTSSGNVTLSYSSLSPLYETAASYSNGQFRLLPREMKMQQYSTATSSWTDKQVVFIGEAVAGASSITTLTTYAYNGVYVSPRFSTAASTVYSRNHNIGCFPSIVWHTVYTGATATTGGVPTFYYAGGLAGSSIADISRLGFKLVVAGGNVQTSNSATPGSTRSGTHVIMGASRGW